MGPGLAGAAEPVRPQAELVPASILTWAALFSWIARSAQLRVLSPGLAGAAVDMWIAPANRVGGPRIVRAAVVFTVARGADLWIVSP